MLLKCVLSRVSSSFFLFSYFYFLFPFLFFSSSKNELEKYKVWEFLTYRDLDNVCRAQVIRMYAGGSVDKGACSQSSWLEFDVWNSYSGEENWLSQVVLWPHTCQGVCTCLQWTSVGVKVHTVLEVQILQFWENVGICKLPLGKVILKTLSI